MLIRLVPLRNGAVVPCGHTEPIQAMSTSLRKQMKDDGGSEMGSARQHRWHVLLHDHREADSWLALFSGLWLRLTVDTDFGYSSAFCAQHLYPEPIGDRYIASNRDLPKLVVD